MLSPARAARSAWHHVLAECPRRTGKRTARREDAQADITAGDFADLEAGEIEGWLGSIAQEERLKRKHGV
jgi:hypothetical protein